MNASRINTILIVVLFVLLCRTMFKVRDLEFVNMDFAAFFGYECRFPFQGLFRFSERYDNALKFHLEQTGKDGAK